MICFASDNYAGAHDLVLTALAEANAGYARPYGEDDFTTALTEKLRGLFEDDTLQVHPSFGGTGSNVLALRALLPRWGSVVAPATAHINTDEASAPEHMSGIKILTQETPDGKLRPSDIISACEVVGNIHSAQPCAVSISNTTEVGTVYTPAEIASLVATAHENGLLFHVDGARIFNALDATGATIKEMFGDTHVDSISFGGTKNGCVLAEAVIMLNKNKRFEIAEATRTTDAAKYGQKQMGQLPSKARFISAQLSRLLEDGSSKGTSLAMELAHQANAKMAKFIELLKGVPIDFGYEVQANACFPILPQRVYDELKTKHHFYDWRSLVGAMQVRWMTSWASTDAEIEEFAADVIAAYSKL